MIAAKVRKKPHPLMDRAFYFCLTNVLQGYFIYGTVFLLPVLSGSYCAP